MKSFQGPAHTPGNAIFDNISELFRTLQLLRRGIQTEIRYHDFKLVDCTNPDDIIDHTKTLLLILLAYGRIQTIPLVHFFTELDSSLVASFL